ncbi:TMEM173 [Branchiostoma lanceolatum]|uniref:TMEM173 protein n=1 Tax=Branchiostoma lanceolatum TaxID=7740 RepID=A0A8K0F2T8_BRALA|nr:TMEM173 [Branchiostoma lanceolatum]
MMHQEREQNNGFGPIPSPRGRLAAGFHWALGAAWLGWLFYKVKTANTGISGVYIQLSSGQKCVNDTHLYLEDSMFTHYMFITAAVLLTSLISGLLHSVGFFMEELKHIDSRHGGRYLEALQSCLHFPIKHACAVLVVILLVLWFLKTETFLQLCSQYQDLLLLLAGVELFKHSFNFMKSAEVEIMEQVEGSKQNIAHGLAWSFYTGYLKIILPNLHDRIERSPWKDKIHPTAWRLLVLLPLKCEVQANLEDGDSNIKFEYCIVEYATNVQTLYEMQTECEGFSREAREQQVKLLYLTLKNIIDGDRACRDKVVLVPLDITDDEDHKLAKVILRTLKQLKSGTVDMPDRDPEDLRANETNRKDEAEEKGIYCQDTQDPPFSLEKIMKVCSDLGLGDRQSLPEPRRLPELTGHPRTRLRSKSRCKFYDKFSATSAKMLLQQLVVLIVIFAVHPSAASLSVSGEYMAWRLSLYNPNRDRPFRLSQRLFSQVRPKHRSVSPPSRLILTAQTRLRYSQRCLPL